MFEPSSSPWLLRAEAERPPSSLVGAASRSEAAAVCARCVAEGPAASGFGSTPELLRGLSVTGRSVAGSVAMKYGASPGREVSATHDVAVLSRTTGRACLSSLWPGFPARRRAVRDDGGRPSNEGGCATVGGFFSRGGSPLPSAGSRRQRGWRCGRLPSRGSHGTVGSFFERWPFRGRVGGAGAGRLISGLRTGSGPAASAPPSEPTGPV